MNEQMDELSKINECLKPTLRLLKLCGIHNI